MGTEFLKPENDVYIGAMLTVTGILVVAPVLKLKGTTGVMNTVQKLWDKGFSDGLALT